MITEKNKKTFILKKLEDWNQVIKFMIPKLKPGMIIALSGPLGAGKTTFVQHLAKALGVKSTPRSPTFSLLRTYKVRAIHELPLRRLLHVDAYRIEHDHDLMPLNLEEELAEPGTIMALEWPENVKKWLTRQPNKKIFLKISIDKKGNRFISYSVIPAKAGI
ncbi:MAG: tRNA (adenosine(37)-N6)-threonylcarbamoyltransferase complex ATPase subunit type 1 TsaE [Candidatus Uhrbacteria bacterium]|nr:tRNA (adenosine(37)-N6)-threonylcarbamoyltransferase complex ATPase subunit type 1 TsaE [Candidatus Uhrbacteria bacterium]